MLRQATYPGLVPALALSRISLQYCRAISGLRRRGWQIENKVELHGKVRHGYYRLATAMTCPNPQRGKSPLEPIGSIGHAHTTSATSSSGDPNVEPGMLFGDITPTRHRDDG